MKEIYEKIWKLAKPYYERGRPMDIDHIEWMMQDALLVCEKESVDDTLLLPLVILHDVGYAEVPKGNSFNLNLRKAHMAAGGKIAKKILESVNYSKEKIKTIAHYVSIHDNWALGDNEVYKTDKALGVFNDLDFIWTATPKGFPAVRKIRNLSKKEMIEYLEKDEKPAKRPFATETTKRLYEKYLNDRRKEAK